MHSRIRFLIAVTLFAILLSASSFALLLKATRAADLPLQPRHHAKRIQPSPGIITIGKTPLPKSNPSKDETTLGRSVGTP